MPVAMAATGTTYGGFWIRVLAALIDGVVVGFVIVPVATVSLGFAPLVTIVAYWLYFALMESSARQASLGKMALNLRVTDLEGRRISFERASIRHFAQYLSGLILCIGYIMVGFTPKKQGLHDMIAGTLVIRG